ncbi:MKI67 FHA domain-interacting nucleolar phosphoprotein-like [Limulus polyphemus]|uniref:MKI67 FHA domain-interacting nucleolar phosphoprotein-like n=1 Tax=Limulus polyphemus TaxID=6850 RepID=A0ABM1TSM7_LIMPO|nr:MKI67 FHA domain-interacting nucleolar phosphoprotein-like [Limulus polyphemus]
MYKYFSQFGKIKKLRLGRSKKTGGSRGYAYIEFECDEVAKIVAETMNNYLMFDQLMKCRFIPPEKVHPLTFKGAGKKIFLAKSITISRQNKWKSPEKERKNWVKRARRIKKTQAKLADLGITFDFDLKLPRRPTSEVKSDVPTPVHVESNIHVPQQDKDVDVIEIDSSEDEIYFRTPPHVIKTKKVKTSQINVTVDNNTKTLKKIETVSVKKPPSSANKETLSDMNKKENIRDKTPKNRRSYIKQKAISATKKVVSKKLTTNSSSKTRKSL